MNGTTNRGRRRKKSDSTTLSIPIQFFVANHLVQHKEEQRYNRTKTLPIILILSNSRMKEIVASIVYMTYDSMLKGKLLLRMESVCGYIQKEYFVHKFLNL